MSDYRPICDIWILGRPKVAYYGAYPAGFLHRARQLLGVGLADPVLHVCGGKIRDYPFRGLGPHDKTLDLDPACAPDFLRDARDPFPRRELGLGETEWSAVLIDRPYSEADATHYVPGADKLPSARLLVKNAINVVPVGGKVGMLDYLVPRPPKNAGLVAVIGVWCGYDNRIRAFSVFERRS